MKETQTPKRPVDVPQSENADSEADRSKIKAEVPQRTKKYVRTLPTCNFTIRRPLDAFSSGRLRPECAEKSPERPQCGADTTAFLSDVYNRSTRAQKRRVDVPQSENADSVANRSKIKAEVPQRTKKYVRTLPTCNFMIRRPLGAFSSGRSMVEMLGVLAIAGVLAVAGTNGFSKLMTQHKINQTIEQIGIISAKLSAVGTETASYDGLTNESAIKLRALPSETIVSNNSNGDLVNPFGGDITIDVSTLVKDKNDKQAYNIIYTGLSEEACLALAGHDWGANNNSSLIGLGVAGTKSHLTSIENNLYQDCDGTSTNSYAVACANGDGISLPMPLEDAVNGCGCSGSSCILVLKYF